MSRALRGAATLFAAIVLTALAPEGLAFAHAVGVSSGEYRLDGKVLSGDMAWPVFWSGERLHARALDHAGARGALDLRPEPASRRARCRAIALSIA
jgi:hypothetical protein